MQILNIAGYQFITLDELSTLREQLLDKCIALGLKGTILLSPEGINIALAGTVENVASFTEFLKQDSRFAELTFRESYSISQPFERMKVKVKKEIITMRLPDIKPTVTRAPSVSPQEFKQWLDEERDITVLDTRNDYEIRFGTFADAKNLHIDDFCEFAEAAEKIKQDKPVVMFCTGGIRCEKAALYLLNSGFSKVYQLEGGILNYFAKVGGDHYQGECFVFDQRVALDANLRETGTKQCLVCQGPMMQNNLNVSCEACA